MRKLLSLSLLSAAALLAACGDSDVTVTPAVTEAVPAEVVTSAESVATYTAALVATAESSADGLEPVAVPDTLKEDDTGEPKDVQ